MIYIRIVPSLYPPSLPTTPVLYRPITTKMSDVRDILSLFVGRDAVPEATVAFLSNTDTKIRQLSQTWSNKTFKLHSTPEHPSDSSTFNVDCNSETDRWVECSPSSIFPLPIARFTAELLRTRGPSRLFEDDPAVTALVSSSRLPPLEDEVEAETALIPLTPVKVESFLGARRHIDTLLLQNTEPQLRLAVGTITADHQRIEVFLHSDLGLPSTGRSNRRGSSSTRGGSNLSAPATHSFSYAGLIKSELEFDSYYTSWIVGRCRPTLYVNGAPFDWDQPEEMEIYGMFHSSVAHETEEEDDAFYDLVAEARGDDAEQD